MKPFLTLMLLFSAFIIYGQKLPPIGSEKGVKEKFMMIKKGLPDIKKNLTKKDDMWEDTYNVRFEMGDGIVNFEDSEDDQRLEIKFSSDPYFSGSISDFQNYYKKLVAIIGEVFGPAFAQKAENKEEIQTTTFYEKEKDIFSSRISVIAKISWILDSPYITVEIISNKPFNKS